MDFNRVASYFIELTSTELIKVGEEVKIEDELIGHVGWIKKDLIRVDLVVPVNPYVLLHSGISLNEMKFFE